MLINQSINQSVTQLINQSYLTFVLHKPKQI